MVVYQSLVAGNEGVPYNWENSETGSSGSFTVFRTYKSTEGRVCREVKARAVGGEGLVTKQQTVRQLFNGA